MDARWDNRDGQMQCLPVAGDNGMVRFEGHRWIVHWPRRWAFSGPTVGVLDIQSPGGNYRLTISLSY